MGLERLPVLCAACVLLIGCSSNDDALGSTGEALTDGTDQSSECAPELMMAQASPERQVILQRAARWVNSPVEYSQSNYQDGYRCDCSGFVSMAWDNGESFTTQDMAPNTTDSKLGYQIGWNQMLPGDAVNCSHHMRLYAGMAASGQPCFWEQSHSGTSTMSHTISVDSLVGGGYVPLRSAKLLDSTTDPAGTSGGAKTDAGAAGRGYGSGTDDSF